MPPTHIKDFAPLATRTADSTLPIPDGLPAYTPKSTQPRFDEATVYPYLETNIDHRAMMFEDNPMAEEASSRSVSMYGPSTPFRHWSVIQRYLRDLTERNGYEDLISYNTCVELVEKVADEWRVILRREGVKQDYWWEESFDAVVVANGHYSVAYIPAIPGLQEFAQSRPGSVIHSKHFRGRESFTGKRVVVVGRSVSAGDIAFDLVNTAIAPVHAITIGHAANGYFGDEAFNHPGIRNHPSIERISPDRTVHLLNGTNISNVDQIIFGTGYTWTLPFLASTVPTAGNRVPGLYQHVVWQRDPTLLFVGAVQAGLTFKIFEWQAVFAARLLAGRAKPLPSLQEMQEWEEARIKARGNGPKFALIFPDFEAYFETLRELAGPGEGEGGVGRRLPKFQPE